MTLRRTFAVLLALIIAAGALGACASSGEKDGDSQEPKAAAGFPTGYTTWKKVNPETIVRAEEQIAREVYVKKVGDLAAGTVLVKEQYAYTGGAKGDLQLIAVMRRGADASKDKGWTFAGYDPTTKEAKGEVSACKGCHSLQEDNDWLFTDRSKF